MDGKLICRLLKGVFGVLCIASVGTPKNSVFRSPHPDVKMMNETVETDKEQPEVSVWKQIVAKYQKPSTGRGLWQVINTLLPYALLWVGMYWSLKVSWWLAVPVALLAGAFLVRVFIISHDCG